MFATTEQIPEDSLKTLPVVLHHDAREFYSAINPVLERNKVTHTAPASINPYELYFDSIIFGNIFSLKTVSNINDDIERSILTILNQIEAHNSRGYLLKISNSLNTISYQNPLLSELRNHISIFQTKFDPFLFPLLEQKNIFAYFIKGLIHYEAGSINNSANDRNIGEKYMVCAAAGFLLPALNFLEWKCGYEHLKNEYLEMVLEIKQKKDKLILNSNMENIIEYYISHKLIDLSMQFNKLFIAENIDATFQIDYFRKLIQSLYKTPGFDQSFYKGALKHLKKTTGSMRRGAYFTTSSDLWRIISIGRDLVVTCLCANQVYLGLTWEPSGDNDDSAATTEAILYLMVKSSLTTGINSFSSLVYNCYSIYNSTGLLRMNKLQLDYELKLTALYLASSHDFEEIDEVLAEDTVNYWFENLVGFDFKQNKMTLSQLAVENRRVN